MPDPFFLGGVFTGRFNEVDSNIKTFSTLGFGPKVANYIGFWPRAHRLSALILMYQRSHTSGHWTFLASTGSTAAGTNGPNKSDLKSPARYAKRSTFISEHSQESNQTMGGSESTTATRKRSQALRKHSHPRQSRVG